jgi:hypothetical protein
MYGSNGHTDDGMLGVHWRRTAAHQHMHIPSCCIEMTHPVRSNESCAAGDQATLTMFLR